MGTITLSDEDRRVLARLGAHGAYVPTLVEGSCYDEGELRDRLDRMSDNGLVRRESAGAWTLTGNGRRVLVSPGDGSADERIDTPPTVETRLSSYGLRADREDAVRGAFGFLRYWGDATSSEIRDAVYSEWPGDFETAEAWWEFLVREYLADLPGVEEPANRGGLWRYDGEWKAEAQSGEGRRAFVSPASDDRYASAKHAIEGEAATVVERDAVSEAFATIEERGSATREDLVSTVFTDHPAGHEASEEWYDRLRDVLSAVPTVEPVDDDGWRYVPVRWNSSGDGATHGLGERDRREADDVPDDFLSRTNVEIGGDTVGDMGENVTDDERCPVCAARCTGRVYIDASETVLPSEYAVRTCVAITPSETGEGVGLTLYHHRR